MTSQFLVAPYEPGGTPSPQSSFSDFKENSIVMNLELKNEVKYMPIWNDGCKDFLKKLPCLCFSNHRFLV